MERKELRTGLVALGLVVGLAVSYTVLNTGTTDTSENSAEKANWTSQVEDREPVKATFAGGCFWCTEAVFENRKGMAAAISGYAGGKKSTATYDQVKTGNTDTGKRSESGTIHR